MLYKCANPACAKPFRRLDEGKLFQVETEYFPASESRQALPSKRGRMLRHHIERYWLCDSCSSSLTLTFEQGRGISTIPLPGQVTGNRLPSIPISGLKAVMREPKSCRAAIGRSA
jgi:hypothetical protein